jgi:nucleoid-associated protein YgaU
MRTEPWPPSRRPASRAAWLALPVLLALCLVPAMPGARGASENGVGVGAPDPTLQTLDHLHHQLDTLRKRVEGMEGKLKDSARARKQADQARMEAERHQAAGTQELEQTQAQVKTLQTRQRELEQQLADRQAVIDRLGSELQSEREGRSELAAQVTRLKAQLPEADGGTLNAESARQDASAAFKALKARLDALGPGAGPAKAAAITEAEERLYQSQQRLSRAVQARSLYRVRPSDSLGLISNRFYGSGAQWQTLFEANRHVLEDPDRLTPGMTLVIP